MPTVETDRLFDDFTDEAFRLQQLQTYTIPQEAERLAAFRQGRPLPERSVRNNAWLRRLALSRSRARHGRGSGSSSTR